MQTIPINTYTSPTVILELIYRLKIKHVMCRKLYTAGTNTTLREIQLLMREKSITGVPVVEGKRILGIVSMDDIICALDQGYINDPASKWMSRNLIILEDDMPVSFAISYFDKHKYRRFPVINKDKELVGMITTRDITTGLLVELNREVDRIERMKTDTQSEDTRLEGLRRYEIMKHNFEKAGLASMEIKKRLKSHGIPSPVIRRAAIAAYELEINLVIHSDGGEIISHFFEDRIEITARDSGPGIADVELAMTEGYTTATPWIRSLGFGAGMGLPNAKKVSDEFTITSHPHKGTEATSIIWYQPNKEDAS